MSAPTLHLDSQTRALLQQIRQETGLTLAQVMRAGLESLRRERLGNARTPYDIYCNLDLGPGGYSLAPADRAKQAIRSLLQARRGH